MAKGKSHKIKGLFEGTPRLGELIKKERKDLLKLQNALFKSGQLLEANLIYKLLLDGRLALGNRPEELRVKQILRRRDYRFSKDVWTCKELVYFGAKNEGFKPIEFGKEVSDQRAKFITVFAIEQRIKDLRAKANDLQKQVSKLKKSLKRYVSESENLVIVNGQDVYTVIWHAYEGFKITKAKQI